MSNTQILVYGAEWCAFCHTAMHYLDSKGVKDYTYINIDEQPEKAIEVVQKSGQRGIPVLDIGGDIIVGFDRPAIDAVLAKHNLV